MKLKTLLIRTIIIFISIFFIATLVEAKAKRSFRIDYRSSYISECKKVVKVRSYTKKDGTYVKSHYRRLPKMAGR